MPELQNINTQAFQTIDFDKHQEAKEANPKAIDYQALYEESRAENAALQALVDATKHATAAPSSKPNSRPPVTFAQLQARLQWRGIEKLTDDQLATTFGMDAAPTQKEVLRFFGPNASSREMNHLLQSDPLRYRQLKEFGLARRWL